MAKNDSNSDPMKDGKPEASLSTADTESVASNTSETNQTMVGAPVTKRSPEQRRNIAYNHIKESLKDIGQEIFQRRSLRELRAALFHLTENYEKFSTAHEELSELATTNEASEVNMTFLSNVTSRYNQCRDAYENRIEALKKQEKANPPIEVNEPLQDGIQIDLTCGSSSDGEQNLQAQNPNFTLKLEPIKIPIFNGAKENWVLFRDQFISLVHNNAKMNDAIKMHQLFTHLSEHALRVIKGITPAGANYQRAWTTLKGRYDNNQMLINHHLKRFFNLPVLNRDDPSKLIILIDGVNELTNSLPGLNEPMENWDSILTFCLFNKLDKASQEAWKNHTKLCDKPELREFLNFLDERAQSNETANSSLLSHFQAKPEFKKPQKRSVFHVTQDSKPSCYVCKEAHPLYRCATFRALDVEKRIKKAKDAQVCPKCLSFHAKTNNCGFDKCPVCGKPHNRMLCFEDEKRRHADSITLEKTLKNVSVNHVTINDKSTALLGTAVIKVTNTAETCNNLRCLCDTGSQINLISEDAVKRLVLPRTYARVQLNGIGGDASTKAMGIVNLTMSSINNAFEKMEAVFFVVQKVTMPLPLERIESDSFKRVIKDLADPNFDTPGPIDVLLGVTFYASIFQPGIRKFGSEMIAQNSKLGWILFGSATKFKRAKKRSFITAVVTRQPVNDTLKTLQQFWQQEEPPMKKFKTNEQVECEEIFERTHYRTSSGRYGVTLPLKPQRGNLGQSRENATRQFLALEKRLQNNPEVRKQYIDFMRDYLKLGHMTVTELNDEGYFTPHHCVFSSKKFRTVFNASNSTSSGLSLNDIQLVGEKLQTDLAILLVQFRRHAVALTADIKKMYRQVDVHPKFRKYQKILWREDPKDELVAYELNTITYGQAAAPHCAVRALHQCAEDHKTEFPIGAEEALKYFYVDDYIGGADTIAEATEIKTQLEKILEKGKFELAKWCSNKWSLLDSIPANNTDLVGGVQFEDHEMKSVLGLFWLPLDDAFTFQVEKIPTQEIWTKRQVLSQIGRLYDPNGFVAPITVVAKILIQKIWLEGGDWDQPVTSAIANRWNKFLGNLTLLSNFKIPRWLGMTKTKKSQLHGFCDASINAFAAVVYVRTEQPDGSFSTHLIQAKTRVAPLKKPLTVPRLELCGALLLAQLMHSVHRALQDQVESKTYWCDSQIVLRWIRKHPSELKIYAANRVNDIQELTNPTNWRYVPTDGNPADMASRGSSAEAIYECEMWLQGPFWLSKSENEWPIWMIENSPEQEVAIDEELKEPTMQGSSQQPIEINTNETLVHVLTVGSVRPTEMKNPTNVIEAYEQFDKVLNVIAWVRRATQMFRNRGATSGPLKPEERDEALKIAVTWEQHLHLEKEFASLRTNNPNIRNIAYRELALFINPNDGMIRLNGRIKNSSLPYDFKNPMILPHNSTLATKLMNKAHEVTMHGGAQQMLQYVRQRFWIPRARQLAKATVHACMKCKRHAFRNSEQLMAPLPTYRTTPGKVFENVGVDYCGPVLLKPQVGRTNVALKAYICVFVCLLTKAVHLELVSDLTTDCFIAALRRFVARRGRISILYSDHGTNFVGAANEIIKLKKHLRMLSYYPFAGEFNLQWKFTTERASHHGGIFEAAVKSAKRHLKRCIGEQRLTFEEYANILTQVEACLNSRPLTQLSDDPNDLQPLTPGHFLVGEQLNTFPEEKDLKEIPSNRLTRWQLLQQITQQFWNRWSEEYLHSLINRPKWNKTHRNFAQNDLVIIKEDNQPPTRWKMGRILKVIEGEDGLVRTAILKTSTGILRRPKSIL